MGKVLSAGVGKALPKPDDRPRPALGRYLSTVWPRLLGMTLWMVGSLWWLDHDQLLRDGDEEGHVGAAELFRLALADHRWSAVLHDLWRGDLGEYPPLFPALVGAWWWLVGAGQPGLWGVRVVCLGSLLVTALATAAVADRLLSREGRAAGNIVLLGILALPLSNGLTRHFMPEGLVMALVALSVRFGLRATARPSWSSVGLWGLFLGLGLLSKQTFALYAVGPAAWVLFRIGPRALPGLLLTLFVAGPWYLDHIDQQLLYGGSSMGGGGSASLPARLLYYPVVLALEGLGPALLLGALAGLLLARRESGARSALVLGLVWLLVPLLLLTLIPKKYPRLVVPLVPGALLCFAAGGRRHPALSGVVVAGAWAFTAGASLFTLPLPGIYAAVDPRCPQRWLRPAVDDDLGLSRVAEAARAAGPGPVVVLQGPEIPCDLQTTPPWFDHLAPYLRREGLEREVFDAPRPDAALTLNWGCGPGLDRVEVPLLGTGFCLEPKAGPRPR